MKDDPIAEVFPELDPGGRQIVEGILQAVAKRIIRQFATDLVLTIEGDQKIHWPDYPGAV